MQRASARDPLTAAAFSRLAFALLLSLALHSVLLTRVEHGPALPQSKPAIRARLVPAIAELPATPVAPPVLSPKVWVAAPATVPVIETSPAVEAEAVPTTDSAHAMDAASTNAIRLPVDLNYYSAAELDVYPVPAQPITPIVETTSGGWIRILTLIGETGQVDDAVVFDAEPAGLLDVPALDAVKRARFHPARRDGHDVRSRVLIELRVSDSAVAGAS